MVMCSSDTLSGDALRTQYQIFLRQDTQRYVDAAIVIPGAYPCITGQLAFVLYTIGTIFLRLRIMSKVNGEVLNYNI